MTTKTFYQISTFFTSTSYENMNVANQAIISFLFDGDKFGPMNNIIDNQIMIRRFTNGTSKHLNCYKI